MTDPNHHLYSSVFFFGSCPRIKSEQEHFVLFRSACKRINHYKGAQLPALRSQNRTVRMTSRVTLCLRPPLQHFFNVPFYLISSHLCPKYLFGDSQYPRYTLIQRRLSITRIVWVSFVSLSKLQTQAIVSFLCIYPLSNVEYLPILVTQ